MKKKPMSEPKHQVIITPGHDQVVPIDILRQQKLTEIPALGIPLQPDCLVFYACCLYVKETAAAANQPQVAQLVDSMVEGFETAFRQNHIPPHIYRQFKIQDKEETETDELEEAKGDTEDVEERQEG